jgi:hypothetical protein
MKLQYKIVITILVFLNIFLLFNLKNNGYTKVIKNLAGLHIIDSLRLENLECLINTFNNSNIVSNSKKRIAYCSMLYIKTIKQK